LAARRGWADTTIRVGAKEAGMSDSALGFFDRCTKAIREVDDPAELQRQLRNMVETEYPVTRPIFEAGESMPMHEFLARYQSKMCGGIVPLFYMAQVVVLDSDESSVTLRIGPPASSGNPKSKIQNPKSNGAVEA